MRLKDNVSQAMQKYSIFFVLLVMILISMTLNENFFSPGNLTNIARQLAVATILAYGEMLLIISGMLDLSVGAVLALSGVLSVSFYKATGSLLGAFAVAILVAVLCNIVNAFFVANCKMPAFIVTLAMTMVARGMALYYTSGQNILQISDYKVFGQGNLADVPIFSGTPFFKMIPIPIVFLVLITIVIWYVLNHTRFGRSLYAIGGNEEAAIASGINVIRSKYIAFILNGILVGIAGILYMSRVNAGLPNGAVGYEMEGLTAAIVGGTSFTGGVGTTLGTLVGSFIIGCLNNIMNLQGVDSYVKQIVKGGIIVAAVLYDLKFKNKKSIKVILGNRDTEIKKEQAE
ncbi:ABC transporter permease [Sinanaerobacter sp. ZZT-01]|uniref:ABC transporter permease n=1 Tax=Sinanaerobacter sp. ZZT-01 TaxID=3111540 RepID=UPI002D79FFD5|nr:ABC transporter permease [Sinanaerobacter sp. ZZT-01]WRR94524.1 ABC transporter permease [Sinanaerobacter sp. ZZT-01]